MQSVARYFLFSSHRRASSGEVQASPRDGSLALYPRSSVRPRVLKGNDSHRSLSQLALKTGSQLQPIQLTQMFQLKCMYNMASKCHIASNHHQHCPSSFHCCILCLTPLQKW
ncbi:hypothetical protein AMECASPLE_011988 [Ameca splendens]|uniref:Uncharacterized protein n=1 Tax=Ameca splendens TaxID=208324 RepID=A0ABV0ZWR7_9TELE